MKLWLRAAALAAVVAAPARAGELRAGVGREEITPPVGTPLAGYGARLGRASTGVHDPIHAKALVLDDGATRLAIVTTDMCGITPEITRRVAEEAGFPAERLLLCGSHTHSGPGAYSRAPFAFLVLGPYRESVFSHLVRGIAAALKQAVADLQPASLAVGETELPGFMRNRRGRAIKDPALWLLRVDTRAGRPLAALVNLTAHGTVLGHQNLEFSGDWMAFTQSLMEQEVPGLTALYANGAEGDISPNIRKGEESFEGARRHGEKGARAALRLYAELKPAAGVRLGSKAMRLDLPQTMRSGLLGTEKQTFLQWLSIDDALLVAVPGEMITQLGLALKAHARRQGFAHPAIFGLANDHLGYFLTRAEMQRGGYESTVAFHGEGFGEELTLALAGLIGGDVAPVREALQAPPPDAPRNEP